MKDMKNRKGFTLIELLATIVVIALIFSIVIFLTNNAIKHSKEKTYKVTVNQIEDNANSYLMENNNRLSFILVEGTENTTEYEYQCVTVENLINYGYLDDNVTNSLVDQNTKVLKSDYVYIERDKNTKAITKTEYVNKNNPELYELCGGAMIAQKESGITFIASPGFNEWSRYKDITITYTLKNINDVRTASDYDYNHSYTAESTYDSSHDTLDYVTKTKHVRVLDNGTLSADISLGGKVITSDSIDIDKVDIIGPEVKMNYSGGKTVSRSVKIPLKVTDVGIGVKYSSFTKDDIVVTVGGTTINDITLKQVSGENFELVINNTVYDGEIKLVIDKDKVFDKLENTNEEIIINTGISFNNIYRVIKNQVTTSVKSQTNKVITSTTSESIIYVDPYN